MLNSKKHRKIKGTHPLLELEQQMQSKRIVWERKMILNSKEHSKIKGTHGLLQLEQQT